MRTAEKQKKVLRVIELSQRKVFYHSKNCFVYLTKWNNKVAELTGFSQNETLGKHLVHNFVCPDNRASVQARFYFLFYFLYFIHLFFFHFVLHRFVCCDHFGVLSRDSVFMCWDT
jgi:hypothetical protein